jgi:hypothetical protein
VRLRERHVGVGEVSRQRERPHVGEILRLATPDDIDRWLDARDVGDGHRPVGTDTAVGVRPDVEHNVVNASQGLGHPAAQLQARTRLDHWCRVAFTLDANANPRRNSLDDDVPLHGFQCGA